MSCWLSKRVKSKDNKKGNNAIYSGEDVGAVLEFSSFTCSFHDKWLLTSWRLALFNPSSKSLMEILILLECYCSWRTHFCSKYYFGSSGDWARQGAYHNFLWCWDSCCSAAGCSDCGGHTCCRYLLLLFQPFLQNVGKKKNINKGIISIFRFCTISAVSSQYWKIKDSGRILVQVVKDWGIGCVCTL